MSCWYSAKDYYYITKGSFPSLLMHLLFRFLSAIIFILIKEVCGRGGVAEVKQARTTSHSHSAKVKEREDSHFERCWPKVFSVYCGTDRRDISPPLSS